MIITGMEQGILVFGERSDKFVVEVRFHNFSLTIGTNRFQDEKIEKSGRTKVVMNKG